MSNTVLSSSESWVRALRLLCMLVTALALVPVGFVCASGVRAVYRDFSLDYAVRMTGGEYRRVPVLNMRRCADLCSRQALCRAFSYHRVWGTCNLIARITRTRKYSAYVTGVKIAAPGNSAQAPVKVTSVGEPVAEGDTISWQGRVGRMQLEYGVERTGKGFRVMHREHADECARECDALPNCLSFRYRPRTRECSLFDELVGKRSRFGVVSGIKAVASGESGSSVEERDGFVFYRDVALFGRDYRQLRAFELPMCSAECKLDPGCRAFSYYPESSYCYLKSLATPKSYRKGVISGFRQD